MISAFLCSSVYHAEVFYISVVLQAVLRILDKIENVLHYDDDDDGNHFFLVFAH